MPRFRSPNSLTPRASRAPVTFFDLIDTRTAEWSSRALCAQTDPESFFPEKGGTTAAAKKVCGSCEARAECLQWALDKNIIHGVWGGSTPTDRRRMLKEGA